MNIQSSTGSRRPRVKRRLGIWAFRIGCSLFGLAGLGLHAQTNPPPPTNPLMQLMLSQPSVDVSSPVEARATMEPRRVAVGEKAVYRITLNALEAAVRFPQPVPLPPGLTMIPSARGQFLQHSGNALRPITALNFHVRAGRPGFYAVPAFDLEVYGRPVRVPAAHWEVAEELEPDRPRARELIVQPARTNVFLGESVKVRVLLPGSISNVVQSLTQLQFNGDGVLEDKVILQQKVEPMEIHGQRVATWIVETSVTPMAPGARTFTAQAFTAGLQFSGPVVLTGQALVLGGAQANTLLDSEPVTIQVRPLPAETTTKGFNGFIGHAALGTTALGTNRLRVGDAVRLLVAFHSEDSLSRLVPPPPPQVAGWQVFSPMPADPPPSPASPAGQVAAFAYTLIPLTEEARRTPTIPFSVFDPEAGSYLDLTIPPQEVNVSAEGLPTDWKPAAWTAGARSERKATLHDLAASPGTTVASLVPLPLQPRFVLVQLLPALAFLSVWLWDRRRRFLEAHPEIVRRRRARRALRREQRALRRAAARGDAPGFARRAVSALQIAAAPHFSAEPRALVCGEVLHLFDDRERAGRTGEVIRSCFSGDAGATFARHPENPRSLFALQPELEQLLDRMKERL